MFFFFFSSRRRHTSFSRDWSSDVCSSDLVALQAPGSIQGRGEPKPSGWPGVGAEDQENERAGRERGQSTTADHERDGKREHGDAGEPPGPRSRPPAGYHAGVHEVATPRSPRPPGTATVDRMWVTTCSGLPPRTHISGLSTSRCASAGTAKTLTSSGST